MTGYQVYTRIVHALTAAHWRGYAVHSPMMYGFIREVVIRNRRSSLVRAIVERFGEREVVVADSVPELLAALSLNPPVLRVAVLREPYRSRAEWRELYVWLEHNHAVAAHLQGMLILFLDRGLQKQFFKIRS